MTLSTLEYRFSNQRLLDEALRHSSFVNESGDVRQKDNERLEFLGDAVVNLVVSHLLMKRFPEIREGELSRLRANLVNTRQLAELARRLDLGNHIQFGRGERLSGGHQKDSILAGTFEAVMAAVYLDGGFATAVRILTRLFEKVIETINPQAPDRDYKSRLQEIIQEQGQPAPTYEVVSEEGPDHDKTFYIRVSAGDAKETGQGKNKKAAEQAAARRMLAQFDRT